MKVTLTNAEGHRGRLKVTKRNKWSYFVKYYNHRHHTWYQDTIQLATSNDISFHYLDVRSQTWWCLRSLNASGLYSYLYSIMFYCVKQLSMRHYMRTINELSWVELKVLVLINILWKPFHLTIIPVSSQPDLLFTKKPFYFCKLSFIQRTKGNNNH